MGLRRIFERVFAEAPACNYVIGERDAANGLHWPCAICSATVTLNATAAKLTAAGSKVVCRDCWQTIRDD
jgi:hypothetical protein